jgi:hypothetical protein
VLVPVVQVGNVRMGMHQFAVLVDVAVTAVEAVDVCVIVMPVGMVVLVGVLHRVMMVLVHVSRAQ